MPDRPACDSSMKNETSTGLLATLLLLFNSQACLAAPLWSDFSGAYVAGRGFTLDPDQQRTVSLEYASGYTWGDTFTYLDTTFFRGDERAARGERERVSIVASKRRAGVRGDRR